MSLLQSNKRFLEDNMWFFLGDTSLFCSYSVNSNMKFFISFMCLDAYKTGGVSNKGHFSAEWDVEAKGQILIHGFTKGMFTFLATLNLPLHGWNYKYQLPWRYILWLSANQCQRDSPQILALRLLLRSWTRAWYIHTQMSVNNNHTKSQTPTMPDTLGSC